jgi:hypothetical protein
MHQLVLYRVLSGYAGFLTGIFLLGLLTTVKMWPDKPTATSTKV